MSSAASLKIHAPLLIATAAILIAVDIGVVCLRIWARRLRNLRLGADDYTCLASGILVIGMAISIIISASQHTLGHASTAPPTSDAVNAEYGFYPAQILQIPALGLVKISFLLYYQRVFSKPGKSSLLLFDNLCRALIVCTAAWAIAFTFSWIFICGTDPWIFWHSFARRTGHCVDTTALTDGLAISDFLFDVVIIALPIPMIWHLHLPAVRKLQLTGVFLLGGVTVAASGVRLAVFVGSEAALAAQASDLEWLDSNAIYWALVEVGVAVVAACLPTLSVFVMVMEPGAAVESARSVHSLHSMNSG